MTDGQVVFDITGSHGNLDASLNSATDSIARKTAQWTALAENAVEGIMHLTGKALKGLADLVKNSIDYNAQMQDYTSNFSTLLGSVEEAEKKVAELKQYAVRTPFAMSDLASATQTMLTFGMSSEETTLHLRRLGDISLGDAQKLQSLTLAFAQVSSSGKLMGQDLLQMINAGFNPLQVLAEKTGVSMGDLKAVMSGDQTSEDFQFRLAAARREIEELGVNASESAIILAQIGDDGAISADMVAAAMRMATSEGGRFFNALTNASTNFNAQWSTLMDGLSSLSGAIFSDLFDSLSTTAMPKVNEWVSQLNDAYEKDGMKGLAGAAGGIFDEIGQMALNVGDMMLTGLLNGLTGSAETTAQIKAVLTELYSAAGDSLAAMKETGLAALQWVRDNGTPLGKAAAAAGAGFLLMAAAGNPMATALTAIAAAIALLTTDWTTFEVKYPGLVTAFEKLTGLNFSTVAESLTAFKTAFFQTGGTLDTVSGSIRGAIDKGLSWLDSHGLSLSGAILAVAGAFAAFKILSNPVSAVFAALAGAIALLNTDWTAFETNHPDFVARFEKLTGLDFSTVSGTLQAFKTTMYELGGTLAAAMPAVKDAVQNALTWLNDHGVSLGGALMAAATGFLVLSAMGKPFPGVMTAIAAAVGLFGANWATFEQEHPDFVAAFEKLTGLNFSTVAGSLGAFKTNLSTFFNDVLKPLFTWMSENGEVMEGIIFGLGIALMMLGSPLLGFGAVAAVVITNWTDIKAGIEGAYAAVSTFLGQTVPEAWNSFVASVKTAWQNNVCTPVDNAYRSLMDFLGVSLPEDYSITEELAEKWGNLLGIIRDAHKAAQDFLTTGSGIQWTDDHVRAAYQYVAAMEGYYSSDATEADEITALTLADQAMARLKALIGEEAADAFAKTYNDDMGASVYDENGRIRIPAEWLPGLDAEAAAHLSLPAFEHMAEGLFGDWSDAAKQHARSYIAGMQSGDEAAATQSARALSFEVSAESLSSFVNLVDELSKEGVEIPASWFSGTEASLQSELSRMSLYAPVYAIPDFGSLDGASRTGQGHAAGGLFSGAARLLDRTGRLHTVGESGTEAVVPLDEMWRQMGFFFDAAFAANLANLPVSVMPVPSPASPGTPGTGDLDAMAEELAERFARAIDGMTVEMDKKKVGRLLLPEINRGIQEEANARRWTK